METSEEIRNVITQIAQLKGITTDKAIAEIVCTYGEIHLEILKGEQDDS